MANSTAMIPCPIGEEGFITRFCSPEGVWGAANYAACQQIYCPAMGGLPETPAGTTLEVPCGEHYEGMMHGTCSIYGVWTSVDVTQCGRDGEKR